MRSLLPILALVLAQTAASAEELHPLLKRLVLCQDSWQDFATDPARAKPVGDALNAQFHRDEKKRLHVPNGTVTFLGFPVFELTPDSAGMGVGFTVTVKAPIEKVRKSFEAALGKALKSCESSDGLTHCGLQLAPKRAAMLVSPTNKPEIGTLVGCHYEYQK